MTLTAMQRRAQIVEKSMLGHDVDSIATAVECTPRHVRRILAEPEVKAQLRELEDERLRSVARKAAAFGGGAISVLASIAAGKGQPAAARVSAAKAILDVMLKVSELAELAERVEQLEKSMGAEEHKPWIRTA